MKERIEILVLSSKGHKKHIETLAGRRSSLVRAGQRVEIAGEKDVFTVLRVDSKRHLADLLRDGAVRKVETGIPLSLLRVVSEPGELNDLQISA